MKNESSMLACLIEYLEKNDKYEFIAREVPFAYGLRRADLVACKKKSDHTTAYEIKSDSDNLLKIEDQLSDYKEVFNYVYVVTTNKHLKNVRKIGLWFGIILINSDKTSTLVRKARYRSKLNSSKITSSMTGSINHLSSIDAKKTFVEWLKKRYNPLYSLFKKERYGHNINAHDLQILSLRGANIAKI